MFDGFYAKPYMRLTVAPDQPRSSTNFDRMQRDVPSGEKHWEFVATALLHVRQFATPEFALSASDRQVLELFQRRCVPQHRAANWRLMKTLVTAALSGEACLSATHLEAAGVLQRTDGMLIDLPGIESTQYHAYLLHLVLRFGDRGSADLRQLADHAFAWLWRCAEADGDPNGRGRGQFQLFGYASMLYCARMAKVWGLRRNEAWESEVTRRIEFTEASGALSLFWDSPARNHWLLGYNTPSDYPAFAAFWLGAQAGGCDKPAAPLPSDALKLWVYGDPQRALLLSDGEPFLALTPGVAPAPEPVGLGQSVRALINQVQSLGRRLCNKLPPSASLCGPLGPSVAAKGWLITQHENTVVLRADLGAASEVLPTVWLSGKWTVDLAKSKLTGCIEHEALTWRRGCASWSGHALRHVRGGPLELHLVRIKA